MEPKSARLTRRVIPTSNLILLSQLNVTHLYQSIKKLIIIIQLYIPQLFSNLLNFSKHNLQFFQIVIKSLIIVFYTNGLCHISIDFILIQQRMHLVTYYRKVINFYIFRVLIAIFYFLSILFC